MSEYFEEHIVREQISDGESWEIFSACASKNPDLFFGYEGERAKERNQREAAARAICDTCIVRSDCLEAALELEDSYGVRGGMGSRQLSKLIKVRNQD
ncbi:MAG TPA: WhiB family transcriptional regulator [Candidatus Limnocylindrales bacterium]|nr:WhiB family transcriptional regulator [Candidatus Limnocylindrales bacterium]